MPTIKLETKLSTSWVNKLREECSLQNKRIKIFKIRGDRYQDSGISDYLGFFEGKGLAIEFKVEPNVLEPRQRGFLIDVAQCGNIAMCIIFRHMIDNDFKTPFEALSYAYNSAHLKLPAFIAYKY